jgi:hypothetical protein
MSKTLLRHTLIKKNIFDIFQISTKFYDKRDDFNFKIINFPNMCSNIPASPAYGAYISHLIRYASASSNYSDFLKRHLQNIFTSHIDKKIIDIFDFFIFIHFPYMKMHGHYGFHSFPVVD